MTRWFGQSWGAPICDDTPHVETPVGQPCGWCDELIAAGDRGVTIPHLADVWTERPFHFECQMRMVVGGFNHQQGTCTCCGGTDAPDPPRLTRREAARLACARNKWLRR